MSKVAYKTNGVPFKILSRILWHPAFQSGYPVRFRVATNVTKPTIRFNWHWLDVRLPPEYGRHIRLLSRLAKQLRNGCKGKHFASQPSKSPHKLAKAQTTNGNSLDYKKPTEPKPKQLTAWQREWEALWDRVAMALFGNRETRNGARLVHGQ